MQVFLLAAFLFMAKHKITNGVETNINLTKLSIALCKLNDHLKIFFAFEVIAFIITLQY